MRNAIMTLALAGVLILGTVAPVLAQETDPIAVLKSDGSYREKEDACRALSLRGGPEAVPVLEPMLIDEKYSHMARYALEPMPCAEAGEALRNALAKTSGKIKVGIINSLANRGDVQTVPALIALLSDGDAMVAQQAARALGTLATPEAAKALTDALAQADAASGNREAVCDGLLRCAEALAEKGQRDQAIATYDRLREVPEAPRQVRTAALRGAVLTRGAAQGLPLLMEAISEEDGALFAAALRTARELGGGDDVTVALAEALPALPDERKVRLMQTLGYRGGDIAGPAVLAEAQEGTEAVRVAAVEALTQMGYAPALQLMAQLAWAEDGALTETARNSLSYFPGEEGDAVLVAMLKNEQAPARRVAIELIGQGGLNEPVALLINAAENDADEGVRVAALKSLENHAGMAELPRLLDVLCKTKSKSEIQNAENALRAVVGRQKKTSSADVVIQKAVYGRLPDGPSADVTGKVAQIVKSGAMSVAANNGNFGDPAPGTPKALQVNYTANGVGFSKTVTENQTLLLAAASTPPAIVDAFCSALEESKGQASPSALALLRLLSATETSKALETVRTAAAQGEGEFKQTAQRVLCEWPTSGALPTVMDMARNSPDATLKVLALRGAVRLLKQSEAEAADRLRGYALLMGLAPRADEKKLVLSGLALMPRMDALEMVFAQFGDEAVKAEAVQAAVTICEGLGKSAKEDPSIFNGKDLTGWEAKTDYWRLDDGAIVGRSKKRIPDTTYIWSDVEVADFYFAADVKLDPPTANSGIQFRSKKIDEAGHALGYQGDIGQNVWGRIYHQGGRGKLDWNGRAEEAVKPGEWNRFEILAIGPAIWTAINGKLGVSCLDLDGKDERSGLIAFQIHTGPPQTVRYRNLKLVHNPPAELAGLKADKLIPELTIPGKP